MNHSRDVVTAKNALLIHFAMVMTLAAVGAVSWVGRDVVNVDVGPAVERVLRYFTVFELVVTGFVIARLRAATHLITPEDDLGTWWSEHGRRVLTTWVLCYGVGMTGAAVWLLTNDLVILLAVVVPSILLLMRLAPTRWNADPPDHPTMLVP